MTFKCFLLSTLLTFSPAVHTMDLIIGILEHSSWGHNTNQTIDQTTEPKYIIESKKDLDKLLTKLNSLLALDENLQEIPLASKLWNLLPENPSNQSTRASEYIEPENIEALIKKASDNPNYLFKYIYSLNTIFNDSDAIKRDKIQKTAARRDNTAHIPLGMPLQECKEYELDGYSMLGVTLAAYMNNKQNRALCTRQIEGLQNLDIKPFEKDQRLAKLEFYQRTPELTKFNILICALLGYDFNKEKIEVNQESNSALPINIIQNIVNYIYNDEEAFKVICNKSPLIAYDSFFSKDLA